MKECLLIADDLTGACDSGVHFAAAGLRTIARWAPGEDDAPVLAFSTESRDIDPVEAASRMRALRGIAARVVFKKIDSTLRGNTGAEIVAAAAAFGCDAAVVNPAFPAMGRAVEAGRLSITYDPSFPPVEMAAWLRAHGADSCRHVGAGGIGAAVARGARFVTLDAVCADDLGAIAREILALPGRILWAGSSGLARALAAQLAGPGAAPWLPERGELLFCIGTDHRVTAEQERRLREERPGAAVLRVARGEPPVIARRPAALFISGGDTATLVCRGLAAEAIELRQEIAPGIPIGVLVGGRFPGLTVITKSGGFGAPDDLIHIADYFHA